MVCDPLGTTDGFGSQAAVQLEFAGLCEAGFSGGLLQPRPGHGPIVDRDEVRAHRDMMLVLMDQVQERLDRGMTEDQIVAAGLTGRVDSQVRNPGMTNERFIRQLVQELQ